MFGLAQIALVAGVATIFAGCVKPSNPSALWLPAFGAGQAIGSPWRRGVSVTDTSCVFGVAGRRQLLHSLNHFLKSLAFFFALWMVGLTENDTHESSASQVD